MRHNKKFKHLNRTASHRKSMLENMSISLIMHKRINTTVAKAKALRKFVEPIINRSKVDSTASRREVFRHLQNKEAIKELFGTIAEKVAERPGGYTRILKTGFRASDGADMCFIELVDFNENMLKTKKTTRTRRSRRSSATATEANTPEAASAESAEEAKVTAEEAPVAEVPAAESEEEAK